jgi:uncharacterized protein YndB with AHSA1/START domain
VPQWQHIREGEAVMTAPAKADASAHRDVTLTRIFDAPVQLVWIAWTDPRHMAQWWGPDGFTNPVCELDLRQGGAIRIHMRAPDGTVYPLTGHFEEIVPPERIVFTALARDHDGQAVLESRTIVTFEEVGAQTKLTVHARAVGLAPIAPAMLAGMEMGWMQSLDRLAKLVVGR